MVLGYQESALWLGFQTLPHLSQFLLELDQPHTEGVLSEGGLVPLEYVNDKICVGLFIEDAVQDRHIVGVFLTLVPSRQAALELGHDNAALISRNSEAFAAEDEATVAFGLGKDLELALMKQYRHILREQEVPQLQLACENSNTC